MPPTQILIENYFNELGLNGLSKTEAEKFLDYYTSNGWHVGKQKMRDWKAAARNWKKNIKSFTPAQTSINYEPNHDIINNPNRLKWK